MDNTRFLVRRRRPLLRSIPHFARPGSGARRQTLSLMSLALAVALWPSSSSPRALAQNGTRAPRPRAGGVPSRPAAIPAAGSALGASGSSGLVAPRVQAVNVLILAFDDLSTPLIAPQTPAMSGAPAVAQPGHGARTVGRHRIRPVPQMAVPNTPGSPALAAPAPEAGASSGSRGSESGNGGGAAITPVPQTRAVPRAPGSPREEPAIRPTANSVPGAIEYRALAQQRDKKPPRKKKGLTDDDFRPDPLPLPPTRPQTRVPGDNGASAGDVGTSGADGNTTGGVVTGDTGFGALGSGVSRNSPFAIDSPSGTGSGSAASILGPGRAQAVAQPLRLALMRAGFADVLAVAPGNVVLMHALESRTLSPRVLEAARLGLAQLASASANGSATGAATDAQADDRSAASTSSPPGGAASAELSAGVAQDKRWASLYQAASRVGQALDYRAVVVLGVAPQTAQNGSAAKGALFTLAVVDALHETGEPIAFDEDAGTVAQANASAALTASALVTRSLNALPSVTNAEKVQRSSSYMAQARAAYDAKDFASAQDYLSQVLAFEPKRTEAWLLMADVLGKTDPVAAQRAYRSVLTLEGVDGPSWAKAAVSFTLGTTPSWPQALTAARKALALGYDSSELQQAMATAQMGRALLFRQAERFDKADEADADAQAHLDQAVALAPDDPGPARLMADYLVRQGHYRDALKMLDRIAPQYPDDVELQTLYANTLFSAGGRDEDAFVAWARVWHLSGQAAAPVDSARYRRLSDGFDQRLATLGKRAAQLTSSVAAGTSPRETALLQMSRHKEDMDDAVEALRVMQPPYSSQVSNTHASRVFSADLMSQAMTSYTTYLETGQERMREQANALQRQAILMLNAARTGAG